MQTHTATTVLTLGREWQETIADEQEIWTAYVAGIGTPDEDDLLRRLDDAGERREALEAQIKEAPARTLAEIAVKLAVARQWIADEIRPALPTPDQPEVSEEGRLALSALADLERMSG